MYDGRMEGQKPFNLSSNNYDELVSNGSFACFTRSKKRKCFDARKPFLTSKTFTLFASGRGVKVHEAWTEPLSFVRFQGKGRLIQKAPNTDSFSFTTENEEQNLVVTSLKTLLTSELVVKRYGGIQAVEHAIRKYTIPNPNGTISKLCTF